ncbi:MAG: TRAP transporter small permease subunit [Elusimicrobiaceae bacterium]
MKKISALVFTAENYLVTAEKAALAALLFAMIGGSFLQVVLRLGFSKGILWMDPLLRYCTLWAGFIGAALAARESKHFSLDLAAKIFKGKSSKIAACAGYAVSAVLAGFLCQAALKFVAMERQSGSELFSIGSFGVPAAWCEAILPIGFALVILHSALNIWRVCSGADA